MKTLYTPTQLIEFTKFCLSLGLEPNRVSLSIWEAYEENKVQTFIPRED